ncbi:hypothetical protein V8F06_005169 [Rhypophila decipiens]
MAVLCRLLLFLTSSLIVSCLVSWASIAGRGYRIVGGCVGPALGARGVLPCACRLFPDGPGSAPASAELGGTRRTGTTQKRHSMKWDRVVQVQGVSVGVSGVVVGVALSSECKLVIGSKARVIRITRDLAPELEIEEDLVAVDVGRGGIWKGK